MLEKFNYDSIIVHTGGSPGPGLPAEKGRLTAFEQNFGVLHLRIVSVKCSHDGEKKVIQITEKSKKEHGAQPT